MDDFKQVIKINNKGDFDLLFSYLHQTLKTHVNEPLRVKIKRWLDIKPRTPVKLVYHINLYRKEIWIEIRNTNGRTPEAMPMGDYCYSNAPEELVKVAIPLIKEAIEHYYEIVELKVFYDEDDLTHYERKEAF